MVNTGYAQAASFGNETKYGSAASPSQPFGLIQSVNPTEKNNLIKVRTMGGTRDFSNIVPGKFEVSGSIEYYLQNGGFLRMGMGEDTGTTTTVDSGPKIHTGASYRHIMGSSATVGSECFPSFTMEFADDEGTDCRGGVQGTYNLNRKYTGCRVNSMKISGAVDTPVSVSVDWVGQNVRVSTAAKTSVTQDTADPFVYYQGVVYATTGVVANNTTFSSVMRIAEVNTFDVTINNNLEPVYYISGTTNTYQSKRGVKQLLVKGREYDANLGLHFKNKAMYQRFLGAVNATGPQNTITSTNIVLDLVRSGTIGSSPKLVTDNYCRIILNGCKFNDINITGSPEDIVSQNISVFVTSAKIHFVDSDSNYKL